MKTWVYAVYVRGYMQLIYRRPCQCHAVEQSYFTHSSEFIWVWGEGVEQAGSEEQKGGGGEWSELWGCSVVTARADQSRLTQGEGKLSVLNWFWKKSRLKSCFSMTLVFLFLYFLGDLSFILTWFKEESVGLFTYLCAVKCTHLECMVLNFHTDVNYHLCQEVGRFHHPRKFLAVALKFSPQPLPQAATDRLTVPVGWLFLF